MRKLRAAARSARAGVHRLDPALEREQIATVAERVSVSITFTERAHVIAELHVVDLSGVRELRQAVGVDRLLSFSEPGHQQEGRRRSTSLEGRHR